MLKINQIYHEHCLATMKKMNDNFIDLTVTSPPYDDLRSYTNDSDWNFKTFASIAKELYRITKDGGVVVWVVGDSVIKGSETGSSFKQALYFKEIGFHIHDTMIYEKNSSPFPARRTGNRYTQIFEYMFILSKGKPKTANLICDKENRWVGWKGFGKTRMRDKEGNLNTYEKKEGTPKYSPRNNIWVPFNEYDELYHITYNKMIEEFGKEKMHHIFSDSMDTFNEKFVDLDIRNEIFKYNTGKNYSTKDKVAFEHPAIFPEKLAEDHILTWSNKDDIIYDCFTGSATTIKMAIMNDRNYIGSEISEKYIEIAKTRIQNTIQIKKDAHKKEICSKSLSKYIKDKK